MATPTPQQQKVSALQKALEATRKAQQDAAEAAKKSSTK